MTPAEHNRAREIVRGCFRAVARLQRKVRHCAVRATISRFLQRTPDDARLAYEFVFKKPPDPGSSTAMVAISVAFEAVIRIGEPENVPDEPPGMILGWRAAGYRYEYRLRGPEAALAEALRMPHEPECFCRRCCGGPHPTDCLCAGELCRLKLLPAS